MHISVHAYAHAYVCALSFLCLFNGCPDTQSKHNGSPWPIPTYIPKTVKSQRLAH